MPDNSDNNNSPSRSFDAMLNDVVASFTAAELDEDAVERHTLAVVGAACRGTDYDTVMLEELGQLIATHGQAGAQRALTLLARWCAAPLRIVVDPNQMGVAEALTVNMPSVPIAADVEQNVVLKANYWSGRLIAAAIVGDALTVANLLADITEDALPVVLEKVARYLAGFVKSMASVAGQGWEQLELRTPGPTTSE